MLKDVEVDQLLKSVRGGAKLMRWRLQHLIAQALVLHLLRSEYTYDEFLDELYSEQSVHGMSRDEAFNNFVDDCKTVLQQERLLQQLKPKDASDTRKVKI